MPPRSESVTVAPIRSAVPDAIQCITELNIVIESFGLKSAHVLACTSNNNILVRLINLSDSPEIIKKRTCLGSVNWISADCYIAQLDADEAQIMPNTESRITNDQKGIDNSTQTTTTSTDIHDNKGYDTEYLNKIDWNAPHLTEQQRTELTQLLVEYYDKDIFDWAL